MKLSQFSFDLDYRKNIAPYPSEYRDESRMLVLHRSTGDIEHKIFKDIINYCDEGDVFVFNDTKVFPARLKGNKEKTGAEIVVFLLRELNRDQRLWDVLVDPARKIRIGNKLYFGENDSLVAEVIDNTTSRGRTLQGQDPPLPFRRLLRGVQVHPLFDGRDTGARVRVCGQAGTAREGRAAFGEAVGSVHLLGAFRHRPFPDHLRLSG